MILAQSMIMSGEAIPWFETHQGFSKYLKSMTLRGKALPWLGRF
jgi:hypothetical protein